MLSCVPSRLPLQPGHPHHRRGTGRYLRLAPHLPLQALAGAAGIAGVPSRVGGGFWEHNSMTPLYFSPHTHTHLHARTLGRNAYDFACSGVNITPHPFSIRTGGPVKKERKKVEDTKNSPQWNSHGHHEMSGGRYHPGTVAQTRNLTFLFEFCWKHSLFF